MKKFKVGEYVRIIPSAIVGRIISIEEDMAEVFIGERQVCEYLESLEHLNIHFKHFKIVLKSDGEREVWDSMRKIRGFGRVHLICMEEQHDIFIGYKIHHKRIMSAYVQTVEQAQEWLALNHARTLVESKETLWDRIDETHRAD